MFDEEQSRQRRAERPSSQTTTLMSFTPYGWRPRRGGTMVLSGFVQCIQRIEGAGGVDEGGACIDADGDAERLRDFFPGRASLLRFRRVGGDAAVATQADRDSQRDQLAR